MNCKELYNPDLAIFPIMVATWEGTPANSTIVYQNDALQDEVGTWKGKKLVDLLDVISAGNGEENLKNLIDNETLAISGTINNIEIKYHSHKCIDHIQMAISDNTVINKIRDKEKRTDLINSFLNIGSHELLSPLNVILYSAWGLLQDELSDEQRVAITNIESHANLLNDIASKMLNMIYIKDEPSPETACHSPLHISESINSLLPHIGKYLEGRVLTECSLKSTSPTCINEKYFSDIMAEIFLNLRRNTPEGKAIKISTYDNADSINIVVENECYGIPPDQLDKVFDPLYRYQNSNRHSSGCEYGQGGIGMGLTIVKKYISNAGGKVWFENKYEYNTDKENTVIMHIQFPK